MIMGWMYPIYDFIILKQYPLQRKMLIRQSTIDCKKSHIQKRIASLSQRLKDKRQNTQIQTYNHKTKDLLNQKVIGQIQQSGYKNTQQANTTIKTYKNHLNNPQNKFNKSIQKKPQQKQNKYSKCYSSREKSYSNLPIEDINKDQNANLDKYNDQRTDKKKQLYQKYQRNNQEFNQLLQSSFNYAVQMPTNLISTTAMKQKNVYQFQKNYQNKYTADIGRKQSLLYLAQNQQTQNNGNLYKMLENLVKGQKTLQQQFHKFKQTYEQNLTARTEISYSKQQNDTSTIKYQNQIEAKAQNKPAILPSQRFQGFCMKCEPNKNSHQEQKIKYQCSFSESSYLKQDKKTNINDTKRQLYEKKKPTVTFIPPDNQQNNVLQRQQRRGILKNNDNDLPKNSQNNYPPKQQYYKSVRQKYLYHYLKQNEQSKDLGNPVYRKKQLKNISKSIGIRKNI